MGALADTSCSRLTCPDDDSSGSGSELTSDIYAIKIGNTTAGKVTGSTTILCTFHYKFLHGSFIQ